MTQSNERMFLNHSSQPRFSRKCMEIDVENFNVEIGAQRVTGLFIVESALSLSS